jgi:predicted dehydrogenase
MPSDALGIGFVGTGWMARAHAHALHTINHLSPFPRRGRLVALAGRRPELTEGLARDLGFERWTTRWREVVEDPAVEVVASLGPNDLHAEVALATLALGKAILSEKPLARDAAEARTLRDAARAAGVTNACSFNYRFVPAVRLAKQLASEGRLGQLRHYRAVYLGDWAATPAVPRTWRFERARAGSGVVGDVGSHLVDLLRYLTADEPRTVGAETALFVPQRLDPARSGALLPADTDDAFAATVRLRNGALATLEGARTATGWKGRHVLELHGTEGALWWNMEDLNRLHVFFTADERDGLGGFRDVLVTQPEHPFQRTWWAAGHVLGWEHTFVHQWQAFLAAVLEGRPVSADQASFEDGYRAAVICDALLESAARGERVTLEDEA